jgi:DNA-binding response OmpR family regulator|nr:MAG: transcriptional regulator [Bacteroidota bacterium]
MTAWRLLWVDDEIELLRPHVLFLESKGYAVRTITNGEDAAVLVEQEPFDLILLDEHMPGWGGLRTLEEIKRRRPNVPVVMVTKSEEEHLMEAAIGAQISDYLIKPVNPNQLLLVCKRLLERHRLAQEQIAQSYRQEFTELAMAIESASSFAQWVDIYQRLVRRDLELERGDPTVQQILQEQHAEANRAFGRFIERHYPQWVQADPEERPPLSPDVFRRWVFPLMGQGRPVVVLVIDCLRYDQWLVFEALLQTYFTIQRELYLAILPTATPYARNALFAGLFPADIERRFPGFWQSAEEDEWSQNRHEDRLLGDQLQRLRIGARFRYEKVLSSAEGKALLGRMSGLLQVDLSAIVVNFVDILAHSRSESSLLRELVPDERAYRELVRTWLEHSWLFDLLRRLSESRAIVVITTDHGAIRALRDTKVIGDRDTSTSLRYKYGRNLKCDPRHAILVKDPLLYRLPRRGINTNYILAKEDYYFVYPTQYHRYQQQYYDTFQHGGVSLEEMLLPVAVLQPRG